MDTKTRELLSKDVVLTRKLSESFPGHAGRPGERGGSSPRGEGGGGGGKQEKTATKAKPKSFGSKSGPLGGDVSSKIIAYESGELDKEGVINLFQELVDSGLAWQLQGSYGRMATSLIKQGLVKAKS